MDLVVPRNMHFFVFLKNALDPGPNHMDFRCLYIFGKYAKMWL